MEETCQPTIEKQEWLVHSQWNIMERQLVLTESKTLKSCESFIVYPESTKELTLQILKPLPD